MRQNIERILEIEFLEKIFGVDRYEYERQDGGFNHSNLEIARKILYREFDSYKTLRNFIKVDYKVDEIIIENYKRITSHRINCLKYSPFFLKNYIEEFFLYFLIHINFINNFDDIKKTYNQFLFYKEYKDYLEQNKHLI